MILPSVLVLGGHTRGGTVAVALARRGWDVVLTDPASLEASAVAEMREQGVEVRSATSLLGCIDLGTHVEAELSDGRVENFDLVVDTERSRRPRSSRVIGLPSSAQGDAVERWARDLAAPEATS